MADGALGSHGAWLLEPYSDQPTSRGLNVEPMTSIKETALLAIKENYQLCVHAIGDRANREVLDLYQTMFRSFPSLNAESRIGTTSSLLLNRNPMAWTRPSKFEPCGSVVLTRR